MIDEARQNLDCPKRKVLKFERARLLPCFLPPLLRGECPASPVTQAHPLRPSAAPPWRAAVLHEQRGLFETTPTWEDIEGLRTASVPRIQSSAVLDDR